MNVLELLRKFRWQFNGTSWRRPYSPYSIVVQSTEEVVVRHYDNTTRYGRSNETHCELFEAFLRKHANEHCYCECGGKLKYYDGAVGYEAMVCIECQEHWPIGQTDEQEDEHVKRYQKGIRNN